ncbi:MAG: transcriptional regulator with PAS, ATPase and Fis domain [Candidatus Latescibacterota bacterium]|jgi:transcriptional regulator with PAS, ATPase and Fis domain
MSAVLEGKRIDRVRFEGASDRSGVSPLDSIIGESPVMRRLKEFLTRIGTSSAPVLIQGESGTGKEIVAQAIHQSNPKRTGAFIAENCATLPESLLESELFGYARGAFTGAVRDKRGLFEAADGGTLFLDEIAETSLEVQAKLLRVLEMNEIRPLGEVKTRAIDVRVLAASSRDLTHEVEMGRFRPELYYRLSVVTVQLPPLRERGGDIALLAHAFLGESAQREGKQLVGFSDCVLDALAGYGWPGNVRELRNEVERMAIMANGELLVGEHLLSECLQTHVGPLAEQSLGETLPDAMRRIKREIIEKALGECGANRSYTATKLGISRTNLQHTMRRLGIE